VLSLGLHILFCILTKYTPLENNEVPVYIITFNIEGLYAYFYWFCSKEVTAVRERVKAVKEMLEKKHAVILD
jgi:hypothetical protein